MAKANIGDRVKITTKDDVFEGILMPHPTLSKSNTTIIKMYTGYNAGIDNKIIKKVEVLDKYTTPKEKKAEKFKENKKLPKILVLHTGGTIASKVDYATGGVIAKFSAKDLIELVPELKNIANIKTELVSNMMSEDIKFTDYTKIINAIKKNKEKFDGIIVGHGTDTLAYTSAGLAFALQNIEIPVLLVGSQRSPDRGSSDAAMNLICAAQFIKNSKYNGVAVCMHHTTEDDVCAIINGTKARKMHTSRRDAFKAINDTPIALVDKKGKIEYLKEVKKTKDKFACKNKFSDNVGLLKVHPNIDNKLFEFMCKNYKAIVIEGTGLGHAPTNTKDNEKNYQTLIKFIKKGGIVAITSQCLYGRVHPDVYTNLRRLSSIGCVFCEDMIPETAYIKLCWLFGNYKNKEEVKRLLSTNLVGEINKRILE